MDLCNCRGFLKQNSDCSGFLSGTEELTVKDMTWSFRKEIFFLMWMTELRNRSSYFLHSLSVTKADALEHDMGWHGMKPTALQDVCFIWRMRGKDWRILALRVDCRWATVNAGASLGNFFHLDSRMLSKEKSGQNEELFRGDYNKGEW